MLGVYYECHRGGIALGGLPYGGAAPLPPDVGRESGSSAAKRWGVLMGAGGGVQKARGGSQGGERCAHGTPGGGDLTGAWRQAGGRTIRATAAAEWPRARPPARQNGGGWVGGQQGWRAAAWTARQRGRLLGGVTAHAWAPWRGDIARWGGLGGGWRAPGGGVGISAIARLSLGGGSQRAGDEGCTPVEGRCRELRPLRPANSAWWPKAYLAPNALITSVKECGRCEAALLNTKLVMMDDDFPRRARLGAPSWLMAMLFFVAPALPLLRLRHEDGLRRRLELGVGGAGQGGDHAGIDTGGEDENGA